MRNAAGTNDDGHSETDEFYDALTRPQTPVSQIATTGFNTGFNTDDTDDTADVNTNTDDTAAVETVVLDADDAALESTEAANSAVLDDLLLAVRSRAPSPDHSPASSVASIARIRPASPLPRSVVVCLSADTANAKHSLDADFTAVSLNDDSDTDDQRVETAHQSPPQKSSVLNRLRIAWPKLPSKLNSSFSSTATTNTTSIVDKFDMPSHAQHPGFSRLKLFQSDHQNDHASHLSLSHPVLTRSQPTFSKRTSVPSIPLLTRDQISNLTDQEQAAYIQNLQSEIDKKTEELIDALDTRDILMVQNDQCRDRVSALLKQCVGKEGRQATKHLKSANVLDGSVKKRRRRFSFRV